jgi:hypothetical protein
MMRKAEVAFELCVRRKITQRALLLSSLLAAGMISIPAMAANRDDSSLVWTDNGPVRGFVENRVHEFLGIHTLRPLSGHCVGCRRSLLLHGKNRWT